MFGRRPTWIGLVLMTALRVIAAEPVEWPDWLAGTWRYERPSGSVTEERWTAPRAGLMLGISQTWRGERTAEFEYLRLEADPSAGLRLVALPSGQNETTFALEKVDRASGEWLFANLQHDFPTRISYRRESADTMVATVTGPAGDGSTRGFSLTFRRVPN